MANLKEGFTTGLIEAGKAFQNIGAMRMKEDYLAEEKASAATAATQSKYEFLYKENNNKVIQGVFSLKNLGYFIKCTNLCGQIEMYLENDLPLVVKYSVASLGEIKLCLAPLPSI